MRLHSAKCWNDKRVCHGPSGRKKEEFYFSRKEKSPSEIGFHSLSLSTVCLLMLLVSWCTLPCKKIPRQTLKTYNIWIWDKKRLFTRPSWEDDTGPGRHSQLINSESIRVFLGITKRSRLIDSGLLCPQKRSLSTTTSIRVCPHY